MSEVIGIECIALKSVYRPNEAIKPRRVHAYEHNQTKGFIGL